MRKIEVGIGLDADVTFTENGDKLEESETVFITRMVKLREIKKMLLDDERVLSNEILLDNINRIAANFLLQQEELNRSTYLQILQLALNDTREELEDEESY